MLLCCLKCRKNTEEKSPESCNDKTTEEKFFYRIAGFLVLIIQIC